MCDEYRRNNEHNNFVKAVSSRQANWVICINAAYWAAISVLNDVSCATRVYKSVYLLGVDYGG